MTTKTGKKERMIPSELKKAIIMTARKHYKKALGTLAILLLIVVAYSSCSRINSKLGMENDNVVEEAFEDLIEYKTGVEIDLSPED